MRARRAAAASACAGASIVAALAPSLVGLALVGLPLVGLPRAAAASAPAGRRADVTPAPGSATTLTYCSTGDHDLELTLFEPPATRDRVPVPAVVQVHGGGWEIGHRFVAASESPTVSGLLAAGIAVASIDYRLAPAWRWPAQIHDVRCALRFLRVEAGPLGIDPARIGAWGSSAGGQLVSLLGTADDPAERPAAVVDEFGPADLPAHDWSRFMSGVLRTVFGSPLEAHEHELETASPIDRVAPGDPPFLILQGTADRIVPYAQSEAFARRLEAAGDPVRLVLVHGGGHGLRTPGEDPSPGWISRTIVRFFRQKLAGR